MSARRMVALALLATSWVGCASVAAAQSAFSARGLGLPMEPQDSRSQGLGGVALGLPDPELSWANPASNIGIIAPGMIFTYQYDNYSADGANAFKGQSARFPLLLVSFPLGQRASIMAGFGGFLDQNWQVETPDTLEFDGDTIPYVDRFVSDGGVSRLRFGGSFQLFPGFGLGAGMDLYTGGIDIEEGRNFESGLLSTAERSGWNYSGLGYTVGAHWSPGPAGGVGASVSYGGTLDATARDDHEDVKSYDLPIILQAGASGRLTPSLLVALAGKWSGWSAANDALSASGGAQDTWSAHAGVELEVLRIRDRSIPFRLGARTAVLPFRGEGANDTDSPHERAFSFGAGAPLAGGAVRPDFAGELGRRSGIPGADESFWRFNFSVRVLAR